MSIMHLEKTRGCKETIIIERLRLSRCWPLSSGMRTSSGVLNVLMSNLAGANNSNTLTLMKTSNATNVEIAPRSRCGNVNVNNTGTDASRIEKQLLRLSSLARS